MQVMPNEFLVVGEHKEDHRELLVKGADGLYYEYDPAREQFFRTEPDGRWEIFEDANDISDETYP
jgi:hypothetical protein